MNSLLLIDDTEHFIEELKRSLEALLDVTTVEIRTWVPRGSDANPRDTFNSLVDADTILVITDYDLTSQGLTGLFGTSIVDWCQTLGIPVGDFSRGHASNLPSEPNLFEVRVPTAPDRSAPFIASVFNGFLSIRRAMLDNESLLAKRRPAGVLAGILDVPNLESQFALYGSRLAATNSALLDRIVKYAPPEVEPSDEAKRVLLGYIVGHLLLNAVLRFPGPILSIEGLCGYIGSDDSGTLADQFKAAEYRGPFFELGPFFWLGEVDELLDRWSATIIDAEAYETTGELNRHIVEMQIGRTISRHGCERCGGKNGGFVCPFTKRTVCQLPNCSVSSSSWVPAGARICRIERDFYDELAPILGM